ncbi:uncharacterized protein LOC112569343 isoform X6 [Pomacea canaliculata]|uniref:uncharacterized protein LOC112569343 isoform X6 n=1 Tax=Pomacea canaliculata TaxID=400727 RepID=UPI000D72E357|nr:uncharacterized protein LOC112569343 isoform X6 [Pomacea canaliculata]XP_025102915.1 uncharacterized protein LOC112569343 isoform X6 [Pomacea canaliculata]
MKTFIFCLLLAAVCGENSNSEDFSIMDLDGDGVLQQDELQANFYKIDINGNGYISLSEFISSYASLSQLEFNMGAFIYHDKQDGNEDGVIDQSVILSVMQIMDINGDGDISSEEFEINLLKIWNGVAKESKSILNP